MEDATKHDQDKATAGSFFRYKIFVPLLIGLAVSLFVAASRGVYQLDKTTPATVETIVGSILKAIFDNPYLLMIPPILSQLLSIQFLTGEMKEGLASQDKNNAVQARELRDLYMSTAQVLRSINDLTNTDHKTISRISELTARANTAVRGKPSLEKLLDWRKRELFGELSKRLDNDGKGILSFSSDDEISLNIDIVSVLTPRSIKAVSIDDGEYWKSEEGHTFVADQMAYLRKNISAKIERLFVEKGQNEYSETISDQRQGKITVSRITFERAMAIYNPHRRKLQIEERAEDFVIYDDVCVKKSRGIGRFSNGVEMKDPELILDSERVKGYVDLYSRLSSASTPG